MKLWSDTGVERDSAADYRCSRQTEAMNDIVIPTALRPGDGRFGSGPSKVPAEAIAALEEDAPTFLGTSHRQPTVQFTVADLRNTMAELFALPDGYEVVLGNGGTTSFWDAAAFSLLDRRSQHLCFGEFSSKFAAVVDSAPDLDADRITTEPGDHPVATADAGVDAYALTHNETSTGVMMPIARPEGATDQQLVLVDATSGAAGLRFDPAECDVYYFAPQKCLASDGGLWIALMSPTAIERVERLTAARWVPPTLDLKVAIDNSRKDQTYNTPALATLHLTLHTAHTICEQGGLHWSASRCERSAETLYGWAEANPATTAFVTDPSKRSNTVATIDFIDGIDALEVAAVLRSNGIVDTEPYRKLGRNQLRIAMYPMIDPEDVAALTACIDYVLDQLG